MLHPHKIFMWASILFLTLFILSPFRAVREYSTASLFFFIINVSALYFPIGFYRVLYRVDTPMHYHYASEFWERKRNRIVLLLRTLMLMSALGLGLRLIDKFVFRGFQLSMNMTEAYELVSNSEGSVLGTISAFLYPLAISSLVLAHYIRSHDRKAIGFMERALILIFFFAPGIEAASFGKRGILLILVATYFLVDLWFSFSKEKASLTLLKWAILGGGALLLMVILLNLRLEEASADSMSMLLVGRVVDLIEVQPWVWQWLSGMPAKIENFVAGIFGLWAYMVHGIYEFFYLYDHFNEANAQSGGYTFWIISKFASVVGYTSTFMGPEAVETLLPRSYVYTTLFGPLYIDFVVGAAIFSFMLGALVCYFHRIACRNMLFVPLYIQFICVIAFYPIVNMLTMFQGLYNIVAALVFIVIGNIFLRITMR